MVVVVMAAAWMEVGAALREEVKEVSWVVEEAAVAAGTEAQAALGMEAPRAVLVVMAAVVGSLVCRWDTQEVNLAAVVRAAAVKDRAMSEEAATAEAATAEATTAETATVAVVMDRVVSVEAATEEEAKVAAVKGEAVTAAATMVGAACSSLHTHMAPPHTSCRSSRTCRPLCASRCRIEKGSPTNCRSAERQS